MRKIIESDDDEEEKKPEEEQDEEEQACIALLTKCQVVQSGSECQIYIWDYFESTSMELVKQIVYYF